MKNMTISDVISVVVLAFLVGLTINIANGHTPCEFEPQCEYILVPNPYTAEMEETLVCNDH